MEQLMPDHQETRPSLVLRLKNARDEEAWREFLSLYQPLLLRLLGSLGVKEADALDVCQQVLAAVAKDVEQWTSDGKPGSFRRWLFQIVRNRAIKFLVAERKRISAAGGSSGVRRLEAQPDRAASLSDVFEREYRQQLLLLAAEQIRGEFHENTWLAFWKTRVEGQPVADVAKELGMSPGNIYVARSRIIARLGEKVHKLEGKEEA